MQDIYADAFTNIAVTGPIVRIDLGSLVPPVGDSKEQNFSVQQRLIMPVDGFLRAFGMTEEVINKMVAAGIIEKKQPNAAKVEAQPAKAEATASPNFAN